MADGVQVGEFFCSLADQKAQEPSAVRPVVAVQLGAECRRPKACRERIRAVRAGISVMVTNDLDGLVCSQLIPPGAACGRTTLALSDQRDLCRRLLVVVAAWLLGSPAALREGRRDGLTPQHVARRSFRLMRGYFLANRNREVVQRRQGLWFHSA
jgi:hypothetical protein